MKNNPLLTTEVVKVKNVASSSLLVMVLHNSSYQRKVLTD